MVKFTLKGISNLTESPAYFQQVNGIYRKDGALAEFTERVQPLMERLDADFAAYFQLYPKEGLFVNATNVELCEVFVRSDLSFICPMPDTMQSAFHYIVDDEDGYDEECRQAEERFNLHLGVNFVVRGERGYDILHFGFSEKDSTKLLNRCIVHASILYQTLREQSLVKGFSRQFPLPMPEGLILPKAEKDFSPEILPPGLSRALEVYNALNKTQQKIVMGLINGKTAKMIAHNLNRSVRTIENQIFNLRQTYELSNQQVLVQLLVLSQINGYLI